MSSTRHIREEDLVGSPPIEVAREGNLLGPRSIQTEAKERHDWTRLRANGGSAGQGPPGQRRHQEDKAQREGCRDIPAHDPRGPQELPDCVPRPRPAIGQTGQHLLCKGGGWGTALDPCEKSNRLLMRLEGTAVLVGGKLPCQLPLEQLFKPRHCGAPPLSSSLRSISRARKARTLAAPAAIP